jgi:recombinational DNA repair protein (RecF pathway)
MTPYHHYPRVGLQYCRCDHCGNTLRSMMMSRIFDKRMESMPYTPMPKYKQKRIGRLRLQPKVQYRLRVRAHPPYKQRRKFNDKMRALLNKVGVK